MVKHIILWTLKEMSDSEKESVKAGIKEGLEGLKGKIPGLVDIKVNTNGRLPSSTADLMLDSTFESEEALKDIQSTLNTCLSQTARFVHLLQAAPVWILKYKREPE